MFGVLTEKRALSKVILDLILLAVDLFVCLFVCLFGVFRPTREIITHMETSPMSVRAANFAVVDSDYLRGPVALPPIAEHLAVDLSLPVITTYVCRSWIRIPNLPLTRRTL